MKKDLFQLPLPHHLLHFIVLLPKSRDVAGEIQPSTAAPLISFSLQYLPGEQGHPYFYYSLLQKR